MRQPNPGNLAASLAGAIDLSALRTPPPSATPAGVPAGAAAANVIEVTEANFQTEVLQRSMQTLVIVDFWSPRTGAPLTVSTALLSLAATADGAWTLARADVDAYPRVAALFRLQSLPYVVALAGGQPVAAIEENLPEERLRPWIQQVLGAVGAAGEGQPQAPLHPLLIEGEEKLQVGDLEGAEAAFRALLAEAPADTEAAYGLARVLLFRRIDGIDPEAAVVAADADAADLDAQLLAADAELVLGRAEQAYARLIGVVRRTAGDERDQARTRLLDLFTLAEPDDPAVAKARRTLANALF
jgi:putative thioredoxin